MKKLLFAACLSISLAASAFTPDEKKISNKIKDNFANSYVDASNVEWSTMSTYVKASCNLNGKKTDVYYDFDGEMIGQSQQVTLESLPVSAKRTFAKKYADYTVKEAIKFDTDDESAYFISAENDKESVILKVTGAGISHFRKTAKN